jgi:lysophospholipase L1-like esterase
MHCPWGCDPAPCELCKEQEERLMYSPRDARPMVVTFGLIVVLVLALLAALLIPSEASAQSMTLPASAFAPGSVISVTVTGNTADLGFVGLYRPGDHDLNHLQWKYMNNQQAAPGVVIASNVLTFTAPASAGSYEFRVFAPYRGQVLGFTVGESGGPPPPPPPTGRIAFNGDSITAPSNVTGSSNWAVRVASGLGFTSMVNLAANSKYASTVRDEAGQMAGAAVCVILIGTNDMAGALNSLVPATMARDAYLWTMRQVINAHTPVCGKVVIVSPPLSFQPLEVLRYEKTIPLLRELCAELDVTFVDLWHYMADLSAVQGPAVYAWWNHPFVDPYHLSAAGHAVIAEAVLRAMGK